MFTKSRLALAAFFVAILTLIPLSASATGTRDLQFTGTSQNNFSLHSTASVGQKFTPGVTGALESFEFELSTFGSPGPITAEVFAENAGLPTGSALATTTVQASSVGTVALVPVQFAFSVPANLVANTAYVIMLTAPTSVSSSGNFYQVWNELNVAPHGAVLNYIGSSGYLLPSARFHFATYMGPVYVPVTATASPQVSAPALANTGHDSSSTLQLIGLGTALFLSGAVAANLSRGRSRKN